MIYFGIPSYKRAGKQSTLDYLESVGVEKSQIIMSVQTEEDEEAYRKAGHDKRVGKFLFSPAKNVSGNTNTILRAVPEGEKIIILDDDIKSVDMLNGKKLEKVADKNSFNKFINFGYSLALKLKTIGFSVYPCHNAYFMSKTYNKAHIGEGTFLALTNVGMLFDESLDTKSDYELGCRIIERFGAFPRLNMYSCNAPHFSGGGCKENWEDKEKVARDAKMLVLLYPNYVKENPKRKGEILMVPRKDKVSVL